MPKPPPSFLGKIIYSLFLAFFGVVGSGLGWIVWKDLLQALPAHQWTKVPCRILQSEVEQTTGRDATRFPARFDVRFRYQAGGGNREATVYRPEYAASKTFEEVYQLMEEYPVGREAVCRVNPANPAAATLEPDRLEGKLALLLIPLVFLLIAGIGLYFVWRPKSFQPVDSSRVVTPQKPRVGCGLFFGLALCAFGGFLFVVVTGRPLSNTWRARSWQPVPCTVLSSHVATHRGKSTTYSVEVTYRYTAGGRDYISNRYAFMGGSSSGYDAKAAVVRHFSPGSTTRCYINPQKPYQAVLNPSFPWITLLGIFPVAIGAFGLWVLWRSARLWVVGEKKSFELRAES